MGTNSRPSTYDDDDIQEVVPVKSEPRETTTPSTAMATANQNDYQDSSLVEHGQGQVALEESYQDDNYDYGNYEEGYDDGSGMIDPNTGMPIAAGADGNKGLDEQIEEMIYKDTTLGWVCSTCGYSTKIKTNLKFHVESQHLE